MLKIVRTPPIISIGAPRGDGSTQLYQALQSEDVLRTLGLEREEAYFAGNPFEMLPHPIKWIQELHMLPVPITILGWAAFAQFLESHVLPIYVGLKMPKVKAIFTDGAGLNVALRATAFSNGEADDDAVFEFHEDLVVRFLKTRKIRPPFYIIPRAKEASMMFYLRENVPGITDCRAEAYIAKGEKTKKRYFREGSGQNSPLELPQGISLGTQVGLSVPFIQSVLDQNLHVVR